MTLRACWVAQYAVLEANAKVNGIGDFSTPTPTKPMDQFDCHFKDTLTPPRESMYKI